MAYALLLFIPLSLALRYLIDAPPTWVFLASLAAIAALADWIRRATEQLADRAGSTMRAMRGGFSESPSPATGPLRQDFLHRARRLPG
jgi:Ca2+/H+ antiporter